MNDKHTPGPWAVSGGDGRMKGYIRRVGAVIGEMAVARAVTGRPHGEFEANARLIAEAPALAEALQDYIDQTTRYLNGHTKNLPDSSLAHAVLARIDSTQPTSRR